MKFKYTALNQQNHQMTGVLEAQSIDAAKDELHKMNLSILVINKISQQEYEKEKESSETDQEKSGIKTFLFNAVDPENQEINGTIDAENIYTAYKRLLTNYHFKISLLHKKEDEVFDLETRKEKFQKNASLWQNKMKEEGIDVDEILKSRIEDKEIEEGQVIDAKVIQEVDRFINQVKDTLAKQNHHFSAPFMGEIQNALDKLERIRTSNNIKHVADVCNEIYDLVSHPDIVDESNGSENTNENEGFSFNKKDLHLTKPEFDLEARSAHLEKVKKTFGKILRKITLNKKAPPSPGKIFGDEGIQKEEESDFKNVLKKTIAYLAASNKIIRKTRKREMYQAFHDWRNPPKANNESSQEGVALASDQTLTLEKKGHSLEEINSFFGWLLFFYISYFFLMNLSLEKNIGLSQDFAIKTLQSPLITNITIFLLWGHLILKVQNHFLKEERLKSIMLIFAGLIVYLIAIVNF